MTATVDVRIEASYRSYTTERQRRVEKEALATGRSFVMFEWRPECTPVDADIAAECSDQQWYDGVDLEKYRQLGGREFWVYDLTTISGSPLGGTKMALPATGGPGETWASIRMYCAQHWERNQPLGMYRYEPDEDTPDCLWQLQMDLLEDGWRPLDMILQPGTGADPTVEIMRAQLAEPDHPYVVLAPGGVAMTLRRLERPAGDGIEQRACVDLRNGTLFWGPSSHPPQGFDLAGLFVVVGPLNISYDETRASWPKP